MKTKHNIISFIIVMITMIMFVGCSKDYLDRPPQSSLVDANFYKTDEQLLLGTADLYSRAWKDYCDQANWKVGDVRAGLVAAPNNGYADYADFSQFQVTGLSASNLNAYKAFFEVIGNANLVMHDINAYGGAAVTPAAKNYAFAECRFMRATAYAYLVMNYGAVPLIDDNTKYLNSPLLKRNTIESVWEFIRRDYLFAMKNLSSDAPQVGRLTKWAAEGMLARTYLTMAGITGSMNQTYLDSAKYYADDVIKLSGKSLLPNYADLFKYVPTSYDNNKESLFELQWVYTTTDSYHYANSMDSQISPDASLSASGDGWGGAWAATNWMLSLYDGLYVNYTTRSNHYDSTTTPGFTLDQRLQPTFMLPGFKYPEFQFIPTATSNFIDIKTKTIFYEAPGGNKLVAGTDNKLANIKKYVVGYIPGQTGQQNYPNDVYMLRLAELYLIYAEASAMSSGGTTSDAQALTYFNAVHMRAGLPAYTNPLTWDVIFQERAKEFAMEGVAWYDLVRRQYYDNQHVYDILHSQDRGLYLAKPHPWPNPTAWSFHKSAWYTTPANVDKVEVSAANFYMPIPQVELNQAPSLADEPVPYKFN
jgi:hypothetical protein